jgi:anaerobic selenocysteine-containing dehydrogenase
MENQEIKIECTGCSNFCGLRVQVENGAIVKLEGNCCHRGIISAKRQLGIIEEYQSK